MKRDDELDRGLDGFARYDLTGKLEAGLDQRLVRPTFVTSDRLCDNCGESLLKHEDQRYCPKANA